MKPLVIDLCCGLGGWTRGFLAEGYDAVGFDIERHQYGDKRYPAQLVLQDIRTLHGSQFRHAAAIVASPPCQAYSHMAMPFSRGKREAKWQRWERDSPFGDFHLNDLFDTCFRLQREASQAAGHHIPLIVENVKGTQPWVGRAAWHYGSYYLWGDVPALMPSTRRTKATYAGTGTFFRVEDGKQIHWRDDLDHDAGVKRPGRNFHAFENGLGSSPSFHGADHETRGVKTVSHANQRDGHNHTRHLTNSRESEGVKQHGSGPIWFDTGIAHHSSRSDSRKAASAMIAEIPFELASHVARCFLP